MKIQTITPYFFLIKLLEYITLVWTISEPIKDISSNKSRSVAPSFLLWQYSSTVVEINAEIIKFSLNSEIITCHQKAFQSQQFITSILLSTPYGLMWLNN